MKLKNTHDVANRLVYTFQTRKQNDCFLANESNLSMRCIAGIFVVNQRCEGIHDFESACF